MNIKYIELAYKEALKAYKKAEIPVGCVIVKNSKVISKSHNNRQNKYIVIGHAEINAIVKAEKKLKDWRLDGCDLYVTLYPCNMCQYIINESRISNIYYLLNNDKSDINLSNNYIKVKNNELSSKYNEIIDNFFKKLRK